MANKIKQIVDEQMMGVNSFAQYQQMSQKMNNEVMDYLAQRFQFALFQMEVPGKIPVEVLQSLWLDIKGDWMQHPVGNGTKILQFIVEGGLGKRGQRNTRRVTVGASSREEALKLGREAIKIFLERELGRNLTAKDDLFIWIVK